MELAQVESYAAQILRAEDTRAPIEVFSRANPQMSLPEAYPVALAYAALRRARGERMIGVKLGATSKAIQKLFGLTAPVFGFNFNRPAFAEGEPIALAELIHPKVETELAFVMGRRLQGPGVTLADVLRATEGVMPAFEIADCRFTSWQTSVADIVCDNSHACGMVLGARLCSVKDLDLRCTGVVVEKDGELAATAATAAALGNPAQAVVWLANALAAYDLAIEEGYVILTGTLSPAFDARTGEAYHATFGGIGSVSARFE